MKKRRLFIIGLLATLTTGCGVNVIPIDVDEATLNSALKSLVEEDSSYSAYAKTIAEHYGNKYLSDSTPVIEINPVGESYSDEFVDDGDAPSYAKILNSKILGGSVEYNLDNALPSAALGRYTLALEYYVPITFTSTPLVEILEHNRLLFDEASSITLPLLYNDDIGTTIDNKGNVRKEFDSYTSRYGDQLFPTQKRYMVWQKEALYETKYDTSDPLVFDFSTFSGITKPSIRINNLSDSYFFVGKLYLIPYTKKDNQAEYLAKHGQVKGEDNIKINAINYTFKNNNSARLSTEQTPSVEPYESTRKLLNVIYAWEESGQEVNYNLYVESAGLYPITLHYFNSNDNFPSFRNIYIDGKIPSSEFKNYALPSTGSSYANETLHDKDGKPLYVYLDQGLHTMTLRATSEPVTDIYDNLMAVYNSINDFAIQIRKLSGASVDTNRIIELEKYITKTQEYLHAYKAIIYDSNVKIKNIVGNDKSSNTLAYFPRMKELIDEFIEEPNDIPINLTKFSSGDSCLAKLIADTANSLKASPVILDMIYLTNRYDDASIIPEANASFISSFNDSLINLGLTFSSNKYKTELVDGELNVWSARSQAYNDILQSMADNYFTPNTICPDFPEGIKVNIRQMPSEDNLIYAYAANTVPDLVLGINSGRAYEFALRGDAAYPMSDFDTTWKYTDNYWNFSPYYWDVVSNMPAGQLFSMLYNDKFYSLPESTSVQLLFTRDDIMNVIGEQGKALPNPDTWQELTGVLKRLQSYSMNFYYPTSASGSLKSLSNTAQFILQNNGTLLSSDGFSMNLRDERVYSALKMLTNFYTIYSLPTEVGSFYNSFRYGTLPMGIGDLSMYLELKYVAPELSGKWSVDLIPGIEQSPRSDGTYADLNGDGIGDKISRWYISNGSSAMIFNNSKLIDEAWLFLQWWMSTPIQVEYTGALQSTFGPSVLWYSANIEATKELPIDESVREVVLEQQKWIVDLQQIPGQYMLMRGLSDIWNSVVFGKSSDGTSTGKVTIGNAIDLEKVIIDREIQRKMEEFGYYDTLTNTAKKDYILRDFNWILGCINNHKRGINGGNAYSGVCPL